MGPRSRGFESAFDAMGADLKGRRWLSVEGQREAGPDPPQILQIMVRCPCVRGRESTPLSSPAAGEKLFDLARPTCPLKLTNQANRLCRSLPKRWSVTMALQSQGCPNA